MNAETDVIDTSLREGLCKFVGDGSGVEFYGVFATWQNFEADVDNIGNFFETFPWQQARRAAAPINVFHATPLTENFQYEPQFRHERLGIGTHWGFSQRRFGVTSAIMAGRGAIRDVQVKR